MSDDAYLVPRFATARSIPRLTKALKAAIQTLPEGEDKALTQVDAVAGTLKVPEA